MDWFLILGMIGFGSLILGWLGYSATTTKIIKEQEKEIAALNTKVKRLEMTISQKRLKKAIPDLMKEGEDYEKVKVQ